MIFFWISLCIIFIAQCSYISLFYVNHGTWGDHGWDGIISFCCTIPFAPILSFIFHFTADNDSLLRKFIDDYLCCYIFNWHNENSWTATTNQEWLEQKLWK
eukprot:325184_1